MELNVKEPKLQQHCPKVLVIIVTWNKKDYVLNLLKCLEQIEYPREQLDILVVDNASEDNTVSAIKQQFPDVQIIQNKENIGGTGGFNTGLAYSFQQPPDKYQYLWLIDNDVLVHRRSLIELIKILEAEPEIAVAGSTMMQMDYPCRINEVGAFFDRTYGVLVLNRHLEVVPNWSGEKVENLLKNDGDLSARLLHCPTMIDVDYVAAASLVVRSNVARQAGLWWNFFIHFDDVEWCLRIGRMGHRVVASTSSLIWHLSAVAKVPTWVLYYDNRNKLNLLKEYGVPPSLFRSLSWIHKKAIYYALIGKKDLADLHVMAIEDFYHGTLGKKHIKLAGQYLSSSKAESIFMEKNIKTVLVPWMVNTQATKLQLPLIKALRQRKDFAVTYLMPPLHHLGPLQQIPGAKQMLLPRIKWLCWIKLWSLRKKYDLIVLSDYSPYPLMCWIGKENLFVNDDGLCRHPPASFTEVFDIVKKVFKLKCQQWQTFFYW